jgi:hypothetical protein
VTEKAASLASAEEQLRQERAARQQAVTVYFGTPNMFITLWFGFDYELTRH